MPRRTARAAYAFARRSGLVSRRRLQVLGFCCTRGQRQPYCNRISRNDVKRHFSDMHDSFCRRLEELAVMGLMIYDHEKQDPNSNCAVDCYRVNFEMSTRELTEGRQRLRESQARLTHGQTLARLLEELTQYVLPGMEHGPNRRNLNRAIALARSRRPNRPS